MNLLKPISIICLLLISFNTLFGAEDTYWLKIESQENLKEFKIQKIQNFSTASKREDYLNQLLQDLKSKMYIEASLDSVWNSHLDTLEVLLHIGKAYEI